MAVAGTELAGVVTFSKSGASGSATIGVSGSSIEVPNNNRLALRAIQLALAPKNKFEVRLQLASTDVGEDGKTPLVLQEYQVTGAKAGSQNTTLTVKLVQKTGDFEDKTQVAFKLFVEAVEKGDAEKPRAGPPGPRGKGAKGDPGQDGGASDIVATAADAIGGHRLVRAVGDGTVDLADASVTAHANTIIGMTLGAATAGADITVRQEGELEEPSFAFSPGPIYAGDDGVPTQTAPSSGFVQQVAVALSATRIVLGIAPAIVVT